MVAIPDERNRSFINLFVPSYHACSVVVWELTALAALDRVPRSETQVSLSRTRGVVQGL